LLLLFWLVGVCLRITVLAVPLLHADLHLTESGIGWLSSLPPMLFAIAAVPGALLIAGFGLVPALLTGLLLGAAGSAARGMFVSTASLFVTTIAMGAGISIVQTVCRRWYASGFRSASVLPRRSISTGFWSARSPALTFTECRLARARCAA
jgi:cyanate permease